MEGHHGILGRDELVEMIHLLASAGEATGTAEGARPWTKAEREAFDKFHLHFAARFHAYVVRTVINPGITFTVSAFVLRAMQRLIRDLHRLRIKDTASAVDLERLILAFFHKQVGWTLSDVRDEEDGDRVPDEFKEAFRTRGKFRGQAPPPGYLTTKQKLGNLLAGLEEKDRDILTTSFSHVDGESGKFVLPPEERDRLCRQYDFANPNALCQYRKRKIAELRRNYGSVA